MSLYKKELERSPSARRKVTANPIETRSLTRSISVNTYELPEGYERASRKTMCIFIVWFILASLILTWILSLIFENSLKRRKDHFEGHARIMAQLEQRYGLLASARERNFAKNSFGDGNFGDGKSVVKRAVPSGDVTPNGPRIRAHYSAKWKIGNLTRTSREVASNDKWFSQTIYWVGLTSTINPTNSPTSQSNEFLNKSFASNGSIEEYDSNMDIIFSPDSDVSLSGGTYSVTCLWPRSYNVDEIRFAIQNSSIWKTTLVEKNKWNASILVLSPDELEPFTMSYTSAYPIVYNSEMECVSIDLSLRKCAKHLKPTDLSCSIFVSDFGMWHYTNNTLGVEKPQVTSQVNLSAASYSDAIYLAVTCQIIRCPLESLAPVARFHSDFLSTANFDHGIRSSLERMEDDCSLSQSVTAYFDLIQMNSTQSIQCIFTCNHDDVIEYSRPLNVSDEPCDTPAGYEACGPGTCYGSNKTHWCLCPPYWTGTYCNISVASGDLRTASIISRMSHSAEHSLITLAICFTLTLIKLLLFE